VRSLALLTLTLLLAAPAAAVGRGGGRETGALRGVVTRGPVAPTCSPTTSCREPANDVTLVFLRDGRAVARTTTGGGGGYRLVLAAGRYGIRVPGAWRWAPTRVLVRAGRVSRLDIAIDTGIR
jgi:hypothetical protein